MFLLEIMLLLGAFEVSLRVFEQLNLAKRWFFYCVLLWFKVDWHTCAINYVISVVNKSLHASSHGALLHELMHHFLFGFPCDEFIIRVIFLYFNISLLLGVTAENWVYLYLFESTTGCPSLDRIDPGSHTRIRSFLLECYSFLCIAFHEFHAIFAWCAWSEAFPAENFIFIFCIEC